MSVTMLVHGIFCLLLFVQEYCSEIIVSEEKHTWKDAMEFCANRSAHLVSSDTALQSYLNFSDVTWTSNTITMDRNCGEVSKTRLCGFTFNNHSIGYRKGFTLFGDCNATHVHACNSREKVPFYVKNCTYHEALECNYTLTAAEVRWLPTGYYWIKRTLFYCTQTTGMLDATLNIKRFCGVYGEDFGQAFGNCSEINFALCTFDTSNAVTGDRDLSMKIAVPVAVCLVLMCGVILVIVYVRRRRRKHKGRDSKYSDTNKTEKGNSMRKIRVNNTNSLHTSVIVSQTGDTSSIVRNKDVSCSVEGVDNTGYCVAKDVDNQTSNDAEDPDYHIYNSANEDDGQYVDVTTKRQEENKPNNVYNHVSNRSDMESDYDSTIPGKQLRQQETDNVYNAFSVDGVDESNEYDFSGSMADTTEAEIEDNTYNTLNLK